MSLEESPVSGGVGGTWGGKALGCAQPFRGEPTRTGPASRAQAQSLSPCLPTPRSGAPDGEPRVGRGGRRAPKEVELAIAPPLFVPSWLPRHPSRPRRCCTRNRPLRGCPSEVRNAPALISDAVNTLFAGADSILLKVVREEVDYLPLFGARTDQRTQRHSIRTHWRTRQKPVADVLNRTDAKSGRFVDGGRQHRDAQLRQIFGPDTHPAALYLVSTTDVQQTAMYPAG